MNYEVAPPAPAASVMELIGRAEQCGVTAATLAADGEPVSVLAALGREAAAAGAGGLLTPHLVLPAVLAPAVAGLITVALGEGDEDFNAVGAGCELESDPDGGGYRLSGTKTLVPAAAEADRVLVGARQGGDDVLVVLDPGEARITARPVQTLARRPHANLSFEEVPVDPAQVVPAAELATRIERAARLASAVQLAEGMGQLDGMLELSLRQGHERHAFSRPLGSQPAFQSACADMAMNRELAEPAVARALEGLDRRDLSVARLLLIDLVAQASRRVIQLQGGKGFLDDHPASRLYRQAKYGQLRWGGAAWHTAYLADQAASGRWLQSPVHLRLAAEAG